MIALPPVEAGAVHVSDTELAPSVPARLVGVPGTVTGVVDDEFDEYEPVPLALVAATRNRYAVPLVKPVTVTDVAVDVPSTNVVHVEPAFDEYWIT